MLCNSFCNARSVRAAGCNRLARSSVSGQRLDEFSSQSIVAIEHLIEVYSRHGRVLLPAPARAARSRPLTSIASLRHSYQHSGEASRFPASAARLSARECAEEDLGRNVSRVAEQRASRRKRSVALCAISAPSAAITAGSSNSAESESDYCSLPAVGSVLSILTNH